MRFVIGSTPFTPFDFFEVALLLLCVLLAFSRPSLLNGLFSFIEKQLVSLNGRGPLVCTLVIFFFPIALRLLLLPAYAPPQPFIHDEYAYLLQSDTFSSGRLANPPSPMASQLETIYVFGTPSYSAEYEPGQGLFLAIGQVLFHCPWVGALLSMGLFCAVTYWALQAWLSPVWSLFGGLLIVIEIGVLSYWTNSYWGGCVPGIGGSLVLGSLARLRGSFRPVHAFLLAFGVFVLLSSRPLEGILLSIVAGAFLLFWLATKQASWPIVLTRVAGPIVLLFIPATLFLAHYNQQVTGKPTQVPYLLYRAKYSLPQGFYWQKAPAEKPGTPTDIEGEYKAQAQQRQKAATLKGLVIATVGKIRRFWQFYIGILLTATLVALPYVWHKPNMDIALSAIIVIFFFENLTYFAYFTHYSAAIAVVIYVVLIQCLRILRQWGQKGLFLARALPLACCISLAVAMSGKMVEPALPDSAKHISKLWSSEFTHGVSRETFVTWLDAQPGKQLVLIHYDQATHENDDVWTYNNANLKNAKIVWARESSDPNENRRLINYFKGRTVWLGEPDTFPKRLIPYPDVDQWSKDQTAKAQFAKAQPVNAQ